MSYAFILIKKKNTGSGIFVGQAGFYYEIIPGSFQVLVELVASLTVVRRWRHTVTLSCCCCCHPCVYAALGPSTG